MIDESAASPDLKESRKLLREEKSSSSVELELLNQKLNSISEQISHPCPTSAAVVPTLTINPRLFHVLTTCQGFSNHWQVRVHYYWYVKQRTVCQAQGSGCDMGGFTRILHSGKSDDLMDEVPTVVVNPLPKSIMKDSSYIVLNRPYAFQEWVATVSIPEKYVIMAEADYLWMRPLPNLMNGEAPGAAHFTYIVPEKYSEIVRKFVGKGLSDEEWSNEVKLVPQIGNSPTMLSVKDLRALVEPWYNMTMRIFDDKEAHEAWNWVLEMYGYSLSTYEVGQHKGMAIVDSFLAHPPFDKTDLNYESKPFYLLHLTYPIRFNSTGGLTEDKNSTAWVFDKRDYGSKAPPRNLEQPPANVDCALCRLIITMLNEATDAIPCWDSYVETGKVTKC